MSLAKPTFGTTKSMNRSNLLYGLHSKLNLTDICTVSPLSSSACSSPDTIIIINPSVDSTPFYCKYQIDKLGELFGNTPCGVLNYTRYLQKKEAEIRN